MPTLASRLRGFGPVGVLAALIVFFGNALFAPLSALLVLLWAKKSETPWHELGFVRPRSWLWTAVVGILTGAALKLVMKSVVMPLLGAPPINQTYSYLTGNAAALPGMMFAVVVGAGFGEETLFRGFLFERLGKLLGRSRWANVAIVLLTSLLFAVVHYPDQGLPGTQQAFVVGALTGTLYVFTRQLWLLMVIHAAFDLVAVGLIYWGLERQVAGWFFH